MVHGKTTILNELEKRNFKKATNYTTRAKRTDEEQLEEYRFVTKDEFNHLWEEGKLLQRAEFNNEYYGISTDSLRENVACIQIVNSVKDVKDKAKSMHMENIKMLTVYVKTSEEERIKRMLKRGDSREYIDTRIKIDEEKFKNAEEVADCTVENINLNDTVEQIINLYKNYNKGEI